MNGWTGELPANSGQERKVETGENQQQQQQQHQDKHQEAVKAAEEAAKQAHAQAHSEAQAAAGAAGLLSGSEDYLQNVGSFVAAALDPLGIDVKIDIETPEGRKSCHVSRQASTASASASTSAGQEQDKEKKEEKEKEKEEEKEEEKEKEEVVINEEKQDASEPAKKAATPSDDEEDWTVVTDKKEAGAAGLYPSLTENPPADIPTAPVASHPDPKIQVALQAMMNMGFSNEG